MTKRGRKKIEIDINQIERLASQGLTQKQIAAALGVSRDTYFRNKANNKEFSDAYERGCAAGIDAVTSALFLNCLAGNPQSQQFYLKNRAGWKDKTDVELEGGLKIQLDISYI